jgi:hypothetical protein
MHELHLENPKDLETRTEESRVLKGMDFRILLIAEKRLPPEEERI